jgi:stearoyl-CoA desaturase (delta-9 desaturase)
MIIEQPDHGNHAAHKGSTLGYNGRGRVPRGRLGRLRSVDTAGVDLVPRSAIISDRRKPVREQIALTTVIVIPFLAILISIPVAWGWGVSWSPAALCIGFYAVSMLGITVGFHRFFTHRSFRTNRALKISLAIAGSMAIEGPLLRWTADHRRHHAFADRDGDPHSPWRFGTEFSSLVRGMVFAHIGWLFDIEETNQEKFVPDLMRDSDLKFISKIFGPLAVLSLALPPMIEAAIGTSAKGVLEALFWGSLVRIFMVHHVSWSVNSICHVIGSRSFITRDESTNFWPLAILSMGESWHNVHHAIPGCARHGIAKNQIDPSARIIYVFEKLGWATDVKWPDAFGYRVGGLKRRD